MNIQYLGQDFVRNVMLVWSLSVTVAYNDGSWSGSEYTYDKETLIVSGPDVSSLPEVKALWSALGMTPKSDAPFRTDYSSVVFRFMSIYTNSFINVLGTTDKLQILSNNATEVSNALAANPEFSSGFLGNADVDIQTMLSNLNSRYVEITQLVPNIYNFADDFDTDSQAFPLGSGVHLLPDGKVLWCGMANEDTAFWVENSEWVGYKGNVVRYNANGTKDTTFIQPAFGGNDNGFVRRIGVQSTGKIVVVGHFDSVNGVTCNRIARLNANGTLDETFNIGTGFGDNALVIKILDDDSMLVGGSFGSFNGSTVACLAKLNADGTLDTTFSQAVFDSGVVNSTVHAIAVDNNGKILVGGNINNRIVRLNSDGTHDESFDRGSGFNGRVTCIEVLDNDQMYVGGWFTTYKGSACNWRIVRLNDDGSLDESFAGEATGLNDPEGSVMTLAVQSDGKVVVGGWFNEYNNIQQNLLIRFNTDGSKDDTFDVQYGLSMVNNDFYSRVMQIVVGNDDALYIAHSDYFYKGKASFGYNKLSANGSYITTDPVVNTSPDFRAQDYPFIQAIRKASDGSILIAGDSGRIDRSKMLRKVDSTGKDVSGFGPVYADNLIRAIGVQSDGKILIGGNFDYVNGYYSPHFCRLNTDGSVDTSFYSITNRAYLSGSVYAVHVMSDDYIWVGGSFGEYGATESSRIIKLTPNGEIEASSALGLDGTVHCIAEDSNGKIYIGGQFSNRIKRLNADGTEDNAFAVGSGFSGNYGNNPRVSSIAIQSDDKVVVGHWYDTYDGNPTNTGISRLNTDGSLDSSFNTGSPGLASTLNRGLVNDVAIQSNGKIVAGGWFDDFDGNYKGGIIRFNSDGTKDESFAGYGIHNRYPQWGGARVAALLIDNNKIYIGGSIGWYNDNVKHAVLRINADGSLDTGFDVKLPYEAYSIGDGGGDMYDSGNQFSTNLLAPYYALRDAADTNQYFIPYTHTPTIIYNNTSEAPYYDIDGRYNYQPSPSAEIRAADKYFGTGSQYFTSMYPGMFVIVAKDISINQFSILGRLGTFGNATVTTYAYDLNVGDISYGVLVKTNADNANFDPSVNHIIVFPGSVSSVIRVSDNAGSYDDDSVSNLTASELYCITVSSYPTAALDESTSRAIATKLIQVLKGL